VGEGGGGTHCPASITDLCTRAPHSGAVMAATRFTVPGMVVDTVGASTELWKANENLEVTSRGGGVASGGHGMTHTHTHTCGHLLHGAGGGPQPIPQTRTGSVRWAACRRVRCQWRRRPTSSCQRCAPPQCRTATPRQGSGTRSWESSPARGRHPRAHTCTHGGEAPRADMMKGRRAAGQQGDHQGDPEHSTCTRGPGRGGGWGVGGGGRGNTPSTTYALMGFLL
jgi:hypothetical protein